MTFFYMFPTPQLTRSVTLTVKTFGAARVIITTLTNLRPLTYSPPLMNLSLTTGTTVQFLFSAKVLTPPYARKNPNNTPLPAPTLVVKPYTTRQTNQSPRGHLQKTRASQETPRTPVRHNS